MAVTIRTSFLLAAAALAIFALRAFAEPPAHDAQPDDDLCFTGRQQSPIDLTGAISANIAPPAGHWETVRGAVVQNTGHTIQVDLDHAGGVGLHGADFALKQFHFHHPSEHTIDGRRYPLEMHLVHQANDGRIAVVGVLFDDGAPSPVLDKVWATTPGRVGKAAVAFAIDPANLADLSGAAYRYEGSLTTPPCSETVSWTVLAQPRTASASQLAAFASMYPDNARAVQPLNRRYVLKTP